MVDAIQSDPESGETIITEEEEPKEPKQHRIKRLSQRVAEAGLYGPRAVKRFVVKHAKGFAYAITTVFMLVVSAWWAWMIFSFYAFLLAVNPVMFWLTIAATVMAMLYFAVMMFYVWPTARKAAGLDLNTVPEPVVTADTPKARNVRRPTSQAQPATA